MFSKQAFASLINLVNLPLGFCHDVIQALNFIHHGFSLYLFTPFRQWIFKVVISI